MLRYTGKPPLEAISSGRRTSISKTRSGVASSLSNSARLRTFALEGGAAPCCAKPLAAGRKMSRSAFFIFLLSSAGLRLGVYSESGRDLIAFRGYREAEGERTHPSERVGHA